MSDLVEAAARAAWRNLDPGEGSGWETLPESSREEMRDQARAALLAAIEAVDVDDIGCALAPSHDEAAAIAWGENVRAVLVHLRKMVEGDGR